VSNIEFDERTDNRLKAACVDMFNVELGEKMELREARVLFEKFDDDINDDGNVIGPVGRVGFIVVAFLFFNLNKS
jgi:hypothetical protein